MYWLRWSACLLLTHFSRGWGCPAGVDGPPSVFFIVSSKVFSWTCAGWKCRWHRADAGGLVCGGHGSPDHRGRALRAAAMDADRSALWPIALSAAEFRFRKRNTFGLLAACFAVYLPGFFFRSRFLDPPFRTRSSPNGMPSECTACRRCSKPRRCWRTSRRSTFRPSMCMEPGGRLLWRRGC